jgi:thymidylate synthase ThyX
MRLIEQTVELEWITPDALKVIETAGRVSYKSEDLITDTSAAVFVNKLNRLGHHSVLEHACASVRVVTDRGISHELVRHRIASFTQECVSGDTKIDKNLTIKEAFDRRKQGLRIKSEMAGRIVPNWIDEVLYNGKAPVYRVTTRLGYCIKTTLAHEFKKSDGEFVRLESLTVGDKVMVNGRPCLLTISDDALEYEYFGLHLAPTEIAEKYMVSAQVVRRRLHKLGIFEKHINDKNPDKYSKNVTQYSIEKMREAILDQYSNGRKPWNLGLTEHDHPGVATQADTLRTHHWDNSQRPNHGPGIVDTVGHMRARELKIDVTSCELCSCDTDLHVHHINSLPHDNRMENLIKVCVKCHARLHCGWWLAVVAHPDEIVSIELVGEEDVYDLRMRPPLHNYIANGFVVHNSTRYVSYAKEKHGGGDIRFILPVGLDEYQQRLFEQAYRDSERHYLEAIRLGCSPQQARDILPCGVKTELVITANFREWIHILTLRTDKAAHPKMRVLAGMIRDVLSEQCPVVFKTEEKP